MAISNIATSSQALASYAAQLQTQATQPRSRPEETEPRGQATGESSQGRDRVTLSTQSSQTQQLQTNRDNEAERVASTQVVERKQLENPQETRSAASKSVTQALEAYVQTSALGG